MISVNHHANQGLVKHLKTLSTEVRSDDDLLNVAAVSAGNDKQIGKLIADAMAKVGRQGVVTMQVRFVAIMSPLSAP
jgi:chaperonin GroEL